MLSRKLRTTETNEKLRETAEDNFNHTITDYGYGKDDVKILHVQRNGLVHSVKEFEVSTRLKLYSKKDYIYGDNSEIVATDSQKNTVYILAKIHGIESPESFGLVICNHFLRKYNHIKGVSVKVEEYPWRRIRFGDGAYKKLHNHAFVLTPTMSRWCTITKDRDDKSPPCVISGIKGLRILKTTKSSFVNFVNDEYRSLPDQEDRIFSTVVRASWEYSSTEGVDFDKAWNSVYHCILNNFAGEPESGVLSPSVQHTLYITEKEVLDTIPQICAIDMEMPNKHYFNVDFSKFPKIIEGDNQEVFLPVDKPSGIIYAKLDRSMLKNKL